MVEVQVILCCGVSGTVQKKGIRGEAGALYPSHAACTHLGAAIAAPDTYVPETRKNGAEKKSCTVSEKVPVHDSAQWVFVLFCVAAI